MGRPKLILPVGGRTVIARVVSALRDGGADRVVVVAPPAEAPGALALIDEAESAGAEVVVPPSQPMDMRASVEHALNLLARHGPPPGAVLLAPADSPGLSPALVARVIGRVRERPGAVVVPVVGDRRGHPVALPWALAVEIRALPAGVGVNALVALHGAEVDALEVDDLAAVTDMDTPDDYARWLGTDAG